MFTFQQLFINLNVNHENSYRLAALMLEFKQKC